MTQHSEADLVAQVDRHPAAHTATETDEETVLRALYGAPDPDGVYRGEED